MTDQADSANAASARDQLDPEFQRAFAWVEKELGAEIVSFERQPRWRPAFFVEAVRDGQTMPLYLRGERGELDHGAYPFEHEVRVLQVMESEGSNDERALGMEALGRCEAADKKPKSDELEFKDPHNKCSCACHRYTCGTCKKFFVKVTVNI